MRKWEKQNKIFSKVILPLFHLQCLLLKTIHIEISLKTRRKKTLERISQVIQLLELSDGEFNLALLKASWN